MGLKDRTYVLTPNHKCEFPSEVIYFDCETYFDPDAKDQVQPLRLGVAIRQNYRHGEPHGRPMVTEFRSADEFWNLVCSSVRARRKPWVIAHNLDFDFAAVSGFSQLDQGGFTVNFWAFAPHMFLLRGKRGRSGVLFADSMGFMRASLASLGKRFGLEKFTMPDPDASDSVWSSYCHRDVEVLQASFEALLEFVSSRNLGRLSLTAPGQALTAFRHRFMGERIVIHRTPSLLPLELASYHGGRVEAFHIGHVPSSPIYYLDVNGMYASVMRDGSYPCQLLGTKIKPSGGQVSEAIRRFEVMADCDVELSDPLIPHLEERLLFPVGRFRSVLAGPEFRLCYERGCVRKVHAIACYRRGRPFGDYIDYFWDLRQGAIQRGDKTIDYLAKLLGNSLYGKFGQRNPIYTTYKADPLKPPGIESIISGATGRRETRLTFAGKTWIKTGEEASRWSSYPIASWITSYARVKLLDQIETAGWDHVFYCDTDSVFVDSTGLDRLRGRLNPLELGALDVRSEGRELTIHGAKDYVLDGQVKLKGVPRKAKEVEPGVYEYMTFDRTRTRLRKGKPDAVHQVTRTKVLTRRYDKGTVTASGRVEPSCLPYGDD